MGHGVGHEADRAVGLVEDHEAGRGEVRGEVRGVVLEAGHAEGHGVGLLAVPVQTCSRYWHCLRAAGAPGNAHSISRATQPCWLLYLMSAASITRQEVGVAGPQAVRAINMTNTPPRSHKGVAADTMAPLRRQSHA